MEAAADEVMDYDDPRFGVSPQQAETELEVRE